MFLVRVYNLCVLCLVVFEYSVYSLLVVGNSQVLDCVILSV